MTDGLRTGWDHAWWLLGYLYGALLPLLLVAALLALGFWIGNGAPHRIRVWRLHRDARRSGRVNRPVTLR